MVDYSQRNNGGKMAITCDYDFDFQADKSDRFIPFVIAFMMYSVIIALISSIFSYDLTQSWRHALNGHMTIEFQSGNEEGAIALTENQTNDILKTLKETPGIIFAKRLKETDILKILDPWLHGTAIPDDFPFPAIFDVEIVGSDQIDKLALNEKLSKISSGVKIHDHADWYAPILKVSNGLFAFAILLSIFIFMTVCITIIFITKKTLNVHKDIVRILQLIGARNAYIASQFKKYYFTIGIKASFISSICGLITVLSFGYIMSANLFSTEYFKYLAMVIVIPLLITFLIMKTAQRTVLFFLSSEDWID